MVQGVYYLLQLQCCTLFFTVVTFQIDLANAECEKLKQANTELQRQRDTLEDEKEDVVKDKDRQVKENQRW